MHEIKKSSAKRFTKLRFRITIKNISVSFYYLIKGRYTYDVHKNGPIFKSPHPPCLATSKILPPLDQ